MCFVFRLHSLADEFTSNSCKTFKEVLIMSDTTTIHHSLVELNTILSQDHTKLKGVEALLQKAIFLGVKTLNRFVSQKNPEKSIATMVMVLQALRSDRDAVLLSNAWLELLHSTGKVDDVKIEGEEEPITAQERVEVLTQVTETLNLVLGANYLAIVPPMGVRFAKGKGPCFNDLPHSGSAIIRSMKWIMNRRDARNVSTLVPFIREAESDFPVMGLAVAPREEVKLEE